jgi:hypothetical protein
MSDLFGASAADDRAAQEAVWAADRAACYERFTNVVKAAKQGTYGPGHRLIADIRAKAGDEVADRAAKELRAATNYEGKKKK